MMRTVHLGEEIPIPLLPEGWITYRNYLFCPDHEIQINVICDRMVFDSPSLPKRKRKE